MSYMNEHLVELLELVLRGLPAGTPFENSKFGKVVSFQAETQVEVSGLQLFFPGTFWAKKFIEKCKWWEYETIYRGWQVRIYACREAPPTCKAITEKRIIVKQIPVTFREELVEQEVIVGWRCGVEGNGLNS